MGIVSGTKGGATAGALGGAIIMLFSMVDKPVFVIIFTLIVGVTFGGMTGALLGAGQGVVAGGLGSYLQQHGRAYRWLWFVTAVLLGGLVGWLMKGEYGSWGSIIGGICGLLSGWVSQRDFAHIVALQELAEEEVVSS